MPTMIRDARRAAGVSVRELARRCEVKPATVQSWERSEEDGAIQLSTLRRALGAMHQRLVVDTEPRFARREQRLGFEFHRAVLDKLLKNPDDTIASAAERLPRLKAAVRGDLAEGWMLEWQALIDARDLRKLEAVMTGADPRSIDLRQVSPFDGVLTRDERARVMERAQ
jgi:transcriptional regulator with XRE-family HTH domain